MPDQNACVSILPDHTAAEQAVAALQSEGIDLRQVSMVSKGYHQDEHPVGFYHTGNRIRYWGLQGAFWGGIWVLLAGAAFFWVPGFGPLAAAGPIVSLLVRGLEGAAIGGGLGVLATALYVMGVPRRSIVDYEKSVLSGKFLLVIHGKRALVEHACAVLHGSDQQVTVHVA